MTSFHLVKKLSLLLVIGLSLRCQPSGGNKFFTLLPAAQTGVTFANNLDENDRFNIIKYLYYYNGGGVSVGDVNNDGLPDIFFTANQLSNKLYLNKGNFEFEDITQKAGLNDIADSSSSSQEEAGGRWKAGVTMADVNGDGWLDIYVCEVGFYKSVNGRNRLYINKGGLPPAPSQGGGDAPLPTSPQGGGDNLGTNSSPLGGGWEGAFTEQAEAYGLAFKGFSQQASFFDYDLDGDLDMFLATNSVHSVESFAKAEKRTERDSMAKDVLFRNDGGHFTDVSDEAGIFGGPMGYGLGLATSDLNNDGLPDVYVTNDFHENDYLYLNSGQSSVPNSLRDGSQQPAVFSPELASGRQPPIFTEKISAAMGHLSTSSMGVDVADVNNNGLPDVMTLDMKPESETILKASTGADHFNLYQMKLSYGYHYQYPRNSLQLAVAQSGSSSVPDSIREGNRDREENSPISQFPNFKYSEVAELAGVAATDWSWSTLFADLDNDGWKDIFITNGIWRRPNDLDYLRYSSSDEVQRLASDEELASKMPQGLVPNYAFRNKGGSIPTFENVSKNWGLDLNGCSNGAAYADLDGDGDLDLVVNNLNAPAAIYRNNSEVFSKNNFLKIKLEGEGGNRFGAGARVSVTAGGMTQMQELSPTRGWESSSDYVLNFGLAKNETVEEVKVAWPGGKVQILKQIPVNQTLTLHQRNAQSSAQSPVTSHQSPFHQFTNPPIYHKENRFVDFNIEPLMPHMLSTQGPKIAVGDVNGDGLDDFYLCGAKAQAGQLAVRSAAKVPNSLRDSSPQSEAQRRSRTRFGTAVFSPELASGGPWEVSSQAAFEQDFLCEDVDAHFFDADSDGDLDLFVVSGGGEYREGAVQLQARLYLNDGKGNFTKTNAGWPATNGACAVPADFNGDGATDLFIGSRSVPGSYGLTPASFIYLNDGKGNFRDATAEICPEISTAGMVTSAVWLPEERRLILAGEWMPVTILDFGGRSAEGAGEAIRNPKSEIRNSNGLWNTLSAADFDGDGDLDLLAGNLGLNCTFAASNGEPLELFVKDFDGNGATDPILTYYRQGKRYPFASKDDLVNQLQDLKKLFVKYADFANSTFDQVFNEKTLEGAVRKQAGNLQSMYFENLGDGNFKATPLPLPAQVAPIHAFLPGDFDGDGKMDALAVGNFYGTQPSIGRLDASYGVFLKGNGKGNFIAVSPVESGFFVPGEGRDLKLAKGEDGKPWILVGRNNEEVLIFEIGKLRN